MLKLDLGMALTPALHLRQEWHFLMILIILVTTLFFCHSLVRICIDLTANERARRGSGGSFSRVPSIAGPHGYAVPREPIRINTQNPDMEGLKEPPPVYGLWRCSVRVNPNEFYWVKRQSAGAMATSPTSPVTGRRYQTRPPSYISDDGVSYVVNAVPEIRAPEPPLPPHPSEVRRLA
ncbi:hypothetical protein FPQ18DRAFT_250762 [Pyronema domesticum]|nr:hypothetical protein FPQ18DRAFT_250762 [Pyronema domesticum]